MLSSQLLTQDLFSAHHLPVRQDADGAILLQPAGRASLEIAEEFIHPVYDALSRQKWEHAIDHALFVAQKTSGVALGRGDEEDCVRKHAYHIASLNDGESFETGTVKLTTLLKMELGKDLKPLAARMLLLFPKYRADGVIYSSLWRATFLRHRLVVSDAHAQILVTYCKLARDLLGLPLIMHEGRPISLRAYAASEPVAHLLAKREWLTQQNLGNYVQMHMLDRLLFLINPAAAVGMQAPPQAKAA